MLDIMHDALKQNDIGSLVLKSSERDFFSIIKTFRNSSKQNVLLLPINFACNGLNIIEASHVIFINSSLNKSDELQAVGRVNRIGQIRYCVI